MLKIICAFILTVTTLAKLGINLGDVALERYNSECYAKANVSLFTSRILYGNLSPQQNFVQTYIYALDAGIQLVHAYFPVNDSFTANQTCSALETVLPPSFNQTVWAQVLNQNSLWSRNISQRVSFLEDLVATCAKKGINIGIYANAVDWVYVMGSQRAGSDILRKVPAWYVNINGGANFDDFSYAGFGEWKNATMKHYASGVYLCYNTYASLYFEGK